MYRDGRPQAAVDALDLDRAGLPGASTIAMDVTDRESVTSAVASVVEDGETSTAWSIARASFAIHFSVNSMRRSWS